MSVGSGSRIQFGQVENRLFHATAATPGEIHSIPKAVHRVGHHPHHAPKKHPLPVKPAITAQVIAGPTDNWDITVPSLAFVPGLVVISGRTYPRAKVSLDGRGIGRWNYHTTANAKGKFSLSLTVDYGNTTVLVSATAPGHKVASTTLTVNRPLPPANHPSIPGIFPTVIRGH
jgi:hypothetical protein